MRSREPECRREDGINVADVCEENKDTYVKSRGGAGKK